MIVEGLEDRVCLSHAYLLVADGTQNQILRFDGTTGAFIDVLVPRNNTWLNGPDLGLICDGAGNVYSDGYNTFNVARYLVGDGSANPAPGQGKADFVSPHSGGLNGTEGLAFGADGNFYVANDKDRRDGGHGNVLQYSGIDGSFMSQVVPDGDSGLGRANDLKFGPDGHLYVDSFDTGQVLRYDENTFAQLPSGSRTGANFIDRDTTHRANGFDWGPDGNLYVSKDNLDFTHGFVDEYDGVTGDFIATFIAPDPMIGFIDGIVWEDGNLYITNDATPTQPSNNVLEYDASGNFVGVFASDPSLILPAGVAFCDPGMAPPGGHHRGGSNDVAALLVSSSKQPDLGTLFASAKAPMDTHSALTMKPPQPVQESLAVPLSSLGQAGESLVVHQASRDSVFAGLDSAVSLGGRLSASDLDLLAG